MDYLTKFDAGQCHKWAQLLLARQQKLNQALTAVTEEDFALAKLLFSQIFNGVNGGRQADPGMTGSLLYHMAMVTKMEAETQVLLDELNAPLPNVSAKLDSIYRDFQSDAQDLTKEITPFTLTAHEIATSQHLDTKEKIALFAKLKKEGKNVEKLLEKKDSAASDAMKKLFRDWADQVIRMRLAQEYETIRGLLVTAELAKNIGVPALEEAMAKVQDKFGQILKLTTVSNQKKFLICRLWLLLKHIALGFPERAILNELN